MLPYISLGSVELSAIQAVWPRPNWAEEAGEPARAEAVLCPSPTPINQAA